MFGTIGYILAGLIVILAPGFLFSVVLYPKAGSLDFWSRIGLSLGLGIMVVIYEAFITARLGALMLGPFLIATFVTCMILGILAYLRGGLGLILSYARGTLKIPHKIITTITTMGEISQKLMPKEPEKPKEMPVPEKERAEIKEEVLRYLVEHRGEIDIAECAKELGVLGSEVEKAIEHLEKEGQIGREEISPPTKPAPPEEILPEAPPEKPPEKLRVKIVKETEEKQSTSEEKPNVQT
jgi:predicted DNA-binding transcriptional regulator